MEQWDVYDALGVRTGITKTRDDVWEQNEYHLGVSLWLVNKRAQVLIQKRAAAKRLFPNVWCNVCGSVMAGETSKAACVREAREEIGIIVDEFDLTFIGRTMNGNNLHDDYAIRNDFTINQFVIALDEVSEVRWASFDDISELFHHKLFLMKDLADLDNLKMFAKIQSARA